MIVIVGGTAQGKLARAKALRGASARVLDGADATPEALARADILDRFHLLVRRAAENGEGGEALARRILRINPDLIVVSDEVGLGVVPMEAFERRWREETGRALCVLAAAAEVVERMVAGIPQRIK